MTDAEQSTAERRIFPLERGSNFRDLGGHVGADGRIVRWRRLFRSGSTAMLTERDIEEVARLKLAGVIDLRSVEERQIAPSPLAERLGVPHVTRDYSAVTMYLQLYSRMGGLAFSAVYCDLPRLFQADYARMFDTLLGDDGGYVVSCSGGADRAGVGVALILSALGVGREAILEDFMLSELHRRPENELPEFRAADFPTNPLAQYYAMVARQPSWRKSRRLVNDEGVPNLVGSFGRIESDWGSLDRYLEEGLGMDRGRVDALRARYLE